MNPHTWNRKENYVLTELKKKRDEGFTLIELLVVVLIIGILVAIAVPKFLGAQTGAKQKAAQSNAKSAEALAQTVYTNTGGKWVDDPTVGPLLIAADNALSFNATTSASANQIGFHVGASDQILTVVSKSTDGTCYFVNMNNSAAGGGTFYWKAAPVAPATTCNANTAAVTGAVNTAADTGWA